LAGGQGTRLRPLTSDRAKPVVPFVNRPFLAYQLALLKKHGVTDVILACSYRVDDVRRALGDAGHLGVSLRYVVETEPLGTGGAVRNAADLASGVVFVLNGDILTDVDLSTMVGFHERRSSRATIFLTRVGDPRQYGLVEVETGGRVRRFREKPSAEEPIPTDTVNAGVYLLDTSLLGRIPSGRAVSIEREFFPGLLADGVPCYGWLAPAYWRDIGSPAAYREAQLDLLAGRVHGMLRPPGAQRGGCWRGEDVVTASDARIVAPSALGDRVQVGSRARVGPAAIVGPDSRLAAGAVVEGAVLWERVTVEEGAVLEGCVLGADVTVGAHARIGPHVVLESGAVIPARTTVTR